MFLARGIILTLIIFGLQAFAQKSQTLEQLTLNGSLVQALKLNPDMVAERINVEVSKDQLTKERSEFSWGLETISRYEDRSKPQNTREFIAVGGISFPGNSARIFTDKNFTDKEPPRVTLDQPGRFLVLENS